MTGLQIIGMVGIALPFVIFYVVMGKSIGPKAVTYAYIGIVFFTLFITIMAALATGEITYEHGTLHIQIW